MLEFSVPGLPSIFCSFFGKFLERRADIVDACVGQSFQMLNTREKSADRFHQKTAIDTVHFLVDFVSQLTSFLHFCPQAKAILHDNGFTER